MGYWATACQTTNSTLVRSDRVSGYGGRESRKREGSGGVIRLRSTPPAVPDYAARLT
jgi:hypothetical protein